jgi:hypothetical protein
MQFVKPLFSTKIMQTMIVILASFFIFSVSYSKEISLVCDFIKIEIIASPDKVPTIIERSKAADIYLKKETINFDLNKKQVFNSSLFIIYNSQTNVGYKLRKIIETDSNTLGFKGVDKKRELIISLNRLTGDLVKLEYEIENDKFINKITTFYSCQNKEKLF